jgi:hypothetical protein
MMINPIGYLAHRKSPPGSIVILFVMEPVFVNQCFANDERIYSWDFKIRKVKIMRKTPILFEKASITKLVINFDIMLTMD